MARWINRVCDGVFNYFGFGAHKNSGRLQFFLCFLNVFLSIWPMFCFLVYATDIHIVYWLGTMPQNVNLSVPICLLCLNLGVNYFQCFTVRPAAARKGCVMLFVALGCVLILAGSFVLMEAERVVMNLTKKCGQDPLTAALQETWTACKDFLKACDPTFQQDIESCPNFATQPFNQEPPKLPGAVEEEEEEAVPEKKLSEKELYPGKIFIDFAEKERFSASGAAWPLHPSPIPSSSSRPTSTSSLSRLGESKQKSSSRMLKVGEKQKSLSRSQQPLAYLQTSSTSSWTRQPGIDRDRKWRLLLNEDGYSSSPLLHQSSSRRNSFSSTIHAPSTSLLHLPTLEEIDRRTASSGKRYLDDAETAGTPGGAATAGGDAQRVRKLAFTVSTGKAGSASASGGETEATAAVNKVYYDYLSDSEYEFECAGFCELYADPIWNKMGDGKQRCATGIAKRIRPVSFTVGLPTCSVGGFLLLVGVMLAGYDHL
ncbi:unnamed protein product [Amoebophrya sp. A25]|nr:unnamed protein product [Amoebophrya sp. A25]|eukprot:GSA25T00025651001.1